MFRKDTEVMTALEEWKKIQDIKPDDIVWDGDDFFYVERVLKLNRRYITYVKDRGREVIQCTPQQHFLDVNGYCCYASALTKHFKPSFIQDGVESVPELTSFTLKSLRHVNFYSLLLKNSDKYYVKIDNSTGLLVKC